MIDLTLSIYLDEYETLNCKAQNKMFVCLLGIIKDDKFERFFSVPIIVNYSPWQRQGVSI